MHICLRFHTGCCNHNRCCRRGGAQPGMQMWVLTRINCCRYFLDSSLHFFYGFITRYWREKRTVWLRGGPWYAFLRKPTGFFFIKITNRCLSRRNSTSFVSRSRSCSFYPPVIFCAPRTFALRLPGDIQCPEFHCWIFTKNR